MLSAGLPCRCAHPELIRARALSVLPSRHCTRTSLSARIQTQSLSCVNCHNCLQTYVRFIANAAREEFGMEGVPMRVYIRGTVNPYASGGGGPGQSTAITLLLSLLVSRNGSVVCALPPCHSLIP